MKKKLVKIIIPNLNELAFALFHAWIDNLFLHYFLKLLKHTLELMFDIFVIVIQARPCIIIKVPLEAK